MKALRFIHSVPRFLTVRAASHLAPSIATSSLSCLQLVDVEPPALPTDGWVRVRPLLSGICGSDLATIFCRGSFYFSAVTSFPFVLGHEVVGRVEAVGKAAGDGGAGFAVGDRVVVEPALGCEVRGIEPVCSACADGRRGNCINIADGCIKSGIQTGFCSDTGGGWSGGLVAHRSQLYRVPDELSNEDAVVVEPLACAVHAVCRADLEPGDTVLILGAGSVGLLTLWALKSLFPECRAWIAARHPHQAEMARRLGADEILESGHRLRDEIVDRTGARRYEPEIGRSMVLGGVDATFDCVGQSSTIDEAIRLTRAQGTVVVVGMPARWSGVEGTAMWFQETRLIGAYAYGVESFAGQRRPTFSLALELAAGKPGTLAQLVTHVLPLEEFAQAVAIASRTGAHAGFKTAFDLRSVGAADLLSC